MAHIESNTQSSFKGVLIADPPGFGITLPTAMTIVRTISPGQHFSVVVAPTSLVDQWQREFVKYFARVRENIKALDWYSSGKSRALSKSRFFGMKLPLTHNFFNTMSSLHPTTSLSHNSDSKTNHSFSTLVTVSIAHIQSWMRLTQSETRSLSSFVPSVSSERLVMDASW